ncbi:MAG: hypothetical protein LUG89_01250, partial [Methanosphaera sp.]|nr:hypothetical protein [Methanosphaera sp.]
MDNKNTKQTKLNEFFNEFNKIPDDTTDNEFSNLESNIVKRKYPDKLVFKYRNTYCPECHSIDIKKTGYSKKSLSFLKYGQITCHIHRYKCNYCNYTFSVDLSSIISGNRNISIAVADKIREINLNKTCSLYEIQETLLEKYNLNIS